MSLLIIDSLLFLFIFSSFWVALLLVNYLRKLHQQKDRIQYMINEMNAKAREAREICKEIGNQVIRLEQSLSEKVENAESLKTDLILFIQRGDRVVRLLENKSERISYNAKEPDVLHLSNPNVKAWK